MWRESERDVERERERKREWERRRKWDSREVGKISDINRCVQVDFFLSNHLKFVQLFLRKWNQSPTRRYRSVDWVWRRVASFDDTTLTLHKLLLLSSLRKWRLCFEDSDRNADSTDRWYKNRSYAEFSLNISSRLNEVRVDFQKHASQVVLSLKSCCWKASVNCRCLIWLIKSCRWNLNDSLTSSFTPPSQGGRVGFTPKLSS